MPDTCEFCEGVLEERLIRTPFHFKGQTIYVDHVPAWVCKQCGHAYFDAPVYKRLEAIASQGENIQETICFPLVDYETALT